MFFDGLVNGRNYFLTISIGEESSMTIIECNLEDCLEKEINLDNILEVLGDICSFINEHNLFQKPIIKLSIRNRLIGRYLDNIAAKMPNCVRNTFSKLVIGDACRIFEYDGYNWRLARVHGNIEEWL